jgi:hypothetical protein
MSPVVNLLAGAAWHSWDKIPNFSFSTGWKEE